MCGISGLINYEVGYGCIEQITDSMHHRGPDNCEFVFYEKNKVWFGHNRLAILDLHHTSDQPISSENKRYKMAYNGEIYNFKSFGNYASDTLMLIDQIQIHGFTKELLRRFQGMFSIAVFDSLENKVHFAVDPIGQKPLYYFQDGDKFAFASTPAALTVLKHKWNLNRDAMRSMFCLGSCIGTETLFEGINRLPGSFMATFDINTSEFKTEQWHFITPTASEKIEELIFDAIDSVKVADVPVNIYLSGGIDSTLVATRFKGHHGIHLESEEQEYAQLVANNEDINLHLVPITNVNKQEILTDYARKTGDCAMSTIQPYLVSQVAKSFGKVAVIANGADELFYGYPRTHSTNQFAHILRKAGTNDVLRKIIELYPDEYQSMLGPMQDIVERYFELRLFVQNDLNKTLDFASMCHSVEVRSPFLDSRLINAALGLNYSEHTSNSFGGKHILKSMLSKLGYSNEFLTRTKIGFSLPKSMQNSNEAELNWCVNMGFIDRKDLPNMKDKYYGRDIVYLSATAASFKAWYNVWQTKINI